MPKRSCSWRWCPGSSKSAPSIAAAVHRDGALGTKRNRGVAQHGRAGGCRPAPPATTRTSTRRSGRERRIADSLSEIRSDRSALPRRRPVWPGNDGRDVTHRNGQRFSARMRRFRGKKRRKRRGKAGSRRPRRAWSGATAAAKERTRSWPMAATGSRVRVVEQLADIPAAALGCLRRHRQSVPIAMPSSRRSKRAARRPARPAGCRSISLLEDATGRLLGAVPLYLKSHSYGEYVFDHGWAAALRARRRALLPEASGGGAVHAGDRAAPAAPSRGRARCGRSAGRRDGRGGAAAQGLLAPRHLPDRSANGSASARPASCSASASSSIGRMPAIATFDDFLDALNSRKRKQIRRERRDALAGGIEIETLTGGAHRDAALGCVLPLLHLDLGPQMGLGLSDARVLRPAGRRAWPTGSCW